MNPVFYTQYEINSMFNKSYTTIQFSPDPSMTRIEQDLSPKLLDTKYQQLHLNHISSQISQQSKQESLLYSPSQNNSPFNIKEQRENSLDSIDEQIEKETLHNNFGSQYEQQYEQINQDEYFKLSFIFRDSQQKNILLEQKVLTLEDELLQQRKNNEILQFRLDELEQNQITETYLLNHKNIQLKDQVQSLFNSNEKLNGQIKTLIVKQKSVYQENLQHYDDCLKATLGQQLAESQLNQLTKEYKRKTEKLQRQVDNQQKSQTNSFTSSTKLVATESFEQPELSPSKSLHFKKKSEVPLLLLDVQNSNISIGPQSKFSSYGRAQTQRFQALQLADQLTDQSGSGLNSIQISSILSSTQVLNIDNVSQEKPSIPSSPVLHEVYSTRSRIKNSRLLTQISPSKEQFFRK